MAYKSPIALTVDDIQSDVERTTVQAIVKAVQHFFPLVDEEELAKALKYDRDQYAAGFIDGRAARDAEIVRCKDCKHHDGECKRMVCCTALFGGWVREDFFCAHGERRDDG